MFANLAALAAVTILVISNSDLVRSQNGVDLPKCSATKVWSRSVTINNTLDESGTVLANVVFENGRTRTGNGSDSWLVNVEQKTESCEGVAISSRLVYTLTVPRRQHYPDYELFPGIGYYKFHPEIETWPRAREICSEEDAHLLIINSEQESSVAVQLFARYPTIKGASDNNYAFVGLQERGSAKGLPHTIFGESAIKAGFARWSPGEPNNPTLDDYMLVNRANGGFADVPIAAGWKVGFICEQEL